MLNKSLVFLMILCHMFVLLGGFFADKKRVMHYLGFYCLIAIFYHVYLLNVGPLVYHFCLLYLTKMVYETLCEEKGDKR